MSFCRLLGPIPESVQIECPGHHFVDFGINLGPILEQSGSNLEAIWEQSGNNLVAIWEQSGSNLGNRRGVPESSGRGSGRVPGGFREGSGRALGRLWEGSGRALGREGSRGVWEGLSPLIGSTLQPFAKVTVFFFILRSVFEATLTKYCKLQ